MQPEYFIGLDIGTTSTKAIVFAASGAVKGIANYGYPLLTPQPDWSEQDPKAIFAAVIRALKDAIAQSQATAADIAAVGVSSAMHSLIVMDAHNSLLTNSITWADNRSVAQADALKRTSFGLYSQTGTPIHPMSPLSKILWLRDCAPDIFNQAARFISIKEYVLYQLFERYVVDYSIASATGLFNLRQLGWDKAAIALCGIREDQLSELVPTTTILRGMKSDYATAIGLHPDTPVVVGANDGVLANLGVGAISARNSRETADPIVVTIGTSGAVRQIVSQPLTDVKGRTFCYNLTNDRWVIGGPSNNGGLVLRWFLNNFGTAEVEQAKQQGVNPYDLLIQAATTVSPGAEGLLFLPFLCGERAPYWNPNARGIFFGTALHHGRSHFIRAILEGILFNLYSITSVLSDLTGSKGPIRASGGFARSKIWLQMMADLFGNEVLVPEVYEGSGFGAAVLAMVAVGAISDISDVQKLIHIRDRYSPNSSSTQRYHQLFEIYQRVYTNTVNEMDQIADFQR
ncbi:gluconokinase [Phormidesmis priestleyi]